MKAPHAAKRNLALLLLGILPALVLSSADLTSDTAAAQAARWPAEKAWTWYRAQPWLVGCNFLPSTAVNDVEMWQKESFDPQTIERELGWAQDLGFNTVRVFVNYVVWEADPAGFKETLKRFLEIADRHGISTLVILLDDCFKPEPRVGKQEDPEPGVHNSQWVQSPGVKRRGDRAAWPKLEQYVKEVVAAFASDKRVLAWELYNEPSVSLPLVEAAFKWAREAKPSQPVTTTIFGNPEMQKRIIELSDVLCFHNYGPLPGVKAEVAALSAHGRPILCTEWMARGAGSRFPTHLPYFKENKMACWNWGLVAGRTQTYFPWGSPKGAPEPKLWHHDILRADGTAFDAREVKSIKVTTGKLPPSAIPQRQVLVPTAEKSPVSWRYTLEKPAGDWFKPDFNAAAWKQGAAPFGTEELPFARKPNTVWTSADLWLRREFEMPAGPFTEFSLLLHHDEDTEVYFNGVLAVKADGYNAAYESFDVTPEAQAALKPGKNHMAVHCHQTTGGQYLDLGIEAVGGKSLSALPGTATPGTRPRIPKDIKAYDLDFNWGPGGPNGFAKPGLWAEADPAKHVAWYKAMGANAIQTFCVSCNGYAWYKNGVVPEQPGLKHDFLPEMVRLGHQEGLLVLGYFCAGSNTKWGQEHPDLSYGFPSEPHIPYTDAYLAYLDAAIRDAMSRTGADGFMMDWLRMPTSRASNGGRWLECEQKLYAQLMGEPFPGEPQLSSAQMTEYGRRAVERCWNVIRKAAKETNPECIVWLTCCDVNDPHIVNSRALRETDWLLNEAGDPQRTADAQRMIGPQTRLITCLANWNGQDPMQIVPAAVKAGIGLYGFTKPGDDSLLPLEDWLARPVSELKGDAKNIAVLARAFHGASLDSTRTPEGRFVESKDGAVRKQE